MQRGVRFGRPATLTAASQDTLRKEFCIWKGSKVELAAKHGISKRRCIESLELREPGEE